MNAAPRGRLLAVLGVAFGLATIVGNTIGAGILRTPGETAALLPSPWLFLGAWIVGALYAFGGANAVLELATAIPLSGGQFNYARRALGNYAGFLVGWSDWIGTAGSATAVALLFAETIGVLVPGLAGRSVLVAAAILVAVTALIWRGVRENALVQQGTSLAKALAFLVLIGAAVVYVAGHGAASQGGSDVGGVGGGVSGSAAGLGLAAAFVLGMQGVIFAYDGWTGLFYFSEEVKEPARDLPRATFGGLLAVTAIYLALLGSFMLVVPLDAIAGQPLAGNVVARTIFGDSGDLVVRLVILVALPSSVVALLPMSARVAYAMGRGGLAPRAVTRVNVGGTPTSALLASAAVSLLLLLTGTVTAVIAVLASFFVATYAVSFASLFVLRVREPSLERPWRAWGHPWTTGVMLAGSIAFLVGATLSDPRNGLIAAGVLVASYPTWWVATRWGALRPDDEGGTQ